MQDERQANLIDILYDDEFKGTFKDAMTLAGYPPTTPMHVVKKAIAKPLIERGDIEMAAGTPQSIKRLLKILEDPELPGAKVLLAAVQTWLDRAGIVKKEKLEIEHTAPNGVVFLPPKNNE